MRIFVKTTKGMKKAFFKLMLVVLGLNVFTACYGPAPIEYRDAEETEISDGTKAADTPQTEEAAEEAASEAAE